MSAYSGVIALFSESPSRPGSAIEKPIWTTSRHTGATAPNRVDGTAARSLDALAREGTRHIQQLDAMLTQIYRKDPVLLGLWQIAKRATPYPTASASTTPPPEGGEGTQPVGS